MKKDIVLSDSDISQEVLCFLPVTHIRDFAKQQDKYLESSLNLVVVNNSRSPLSQKDEVSGHLTNYASSPLKGYFMVAQYSTISYF